MNQEKIKQFVLSQLRAGLSPDEITAQLHAAQWSDESIEAAFAAARDALTPTPPVAPPQPATAADATNMPHTNTPSSIQADMQSSLTETSEQTTASSPEQPAAAETLPPPSGRGSFKTGLKLFTQSIRIMRSNTELLRYAIMSMAWTLLIVIPLSVVAIIDSSKGGILFYKGVDTDGSATLEPTLYGFIVLIVAGYAISTIVAFYGVATSSHTLAIFRGQPGSYKDHINTARKKLPAILVFSLINTTVGYLLSFLEQRLRLIGWIVSRILGALWRLSTSFVLPVIADSDTSGTQAIRSSISLFKSNWGETITGRVAAGGAVMLLYFLVGIPVSIILFIVLTAAFGIVGLLLALLLFILGFLAIAIISSLADSIVTTSLYYYAKYKTIPPSYSPELLSDVFTNKKSKK